MLAPFYLAPDGVEIQHVSKCCIFKNCQNVCRLCYIVLYLIHYWAISSPVVALHIWVSTARYSKWVYYAFPYGPFCKYIFLFFSDHFLCACSMLLRSRIQMSLKYCMLKWYCSFKKCHALVILHLEWTILNLFYVYCKLNAPVDCLSFSIRTNILLLATVKIWLHTRTDIGNR